MFKLVRTAQCAAVCSVAILAACGGGSGTVDNSSARHVTGTAVVPETLSQTAKAVLDPSPRTPLTKSAACPLVPDGYQPATQASIELIDLDGSVVLTTTADACGSFDLNATADGQSVRVTTPGFQPIAVPAAQTTNNALLSALPDGASYEIAALQFVNASSLSALIVDSSTKKAVLGLPASAISAHLGPDAVSVAGVTARSTAVNAEPYSVTLVLDSSGSMLLCGANCYGDEGYSSAQPDYTRFQLAGKAAHAFLDGKKDSDETSLLAFSSMVFRLNNEQFADEFTNAAGLTASYEISESGFTTDASRLRLPVDYYNYRSAFWRNDGDALHPETLSQGLEPNSYYRLSGTTALYSAVVDGVNWISTRANQRRIVIAMTDGLNNTGSETLESATAAAQAAGVPVYTIGYGLDASKSSEAEAIETLKSLASDTGAESSVINGTDIVGLFAGLQTAIRFESLVTLGQSITPGQTLSLTVSTGSGVSTSRNVVAPADPA